MFRNSVVMKLAININHVMYMSWHSESETEHVFEFNLTAHGWYFQILYYVMLSFAVIIGVTRDCATQTECAFKEFALCSDEDEVNCHICCRTDNCNSATMATVSMATLYRNVVLLRSVTRSKISEPCLKSCHPLFFFFFFYIAGFF